MSSFPQTVLLLISLTLIAGLSSHLHLYRDISLSNLNKYLKLKQIDSFENYYSELYIVINTQAEYDSDDVCQHLRNLDMVFEEQSLQQLYYYTASIKLIDGCDINEEVQTLINAYISKSTQEEFREFYYAALLSIQSQNNYQLEYCNKLDLFIGKEGAAKIKKSKTEDNYRIAALLYHLAYQCYNVDQVNKEKLLTTFSIPLQSALINQQEIYRQGRTFVERENSVSTTALFLDSYLSFLPHLTNVSQQAEIELKDFVIEQTVINVLKQQLSVGGQAYERYTILKLFNNEGIKNLVIPVLNNQIYFPTKQIQIFLKFVNIFGDKVNPPLDISASLFRKEKVYILTQFKQLQQQIASNLKFSPSANKTKEYQGFFEVQNEQLNQLGKFQLKMNIESGLRYQIVLPVKLGARVRISDLNFAIVQGKNAKPIFDHYVQENEIYSEVLKATDSSFLHVIFKVYLIQLNQFDQLNFEKNIVIQPVQVSVRLIHPQYPTATFQVSAQFETKKNMYYAILDFGDPEHILPHNGLYSVELLIGDQKLVECKRWLFAKINVDFPSNNEKAPLSDSDYIKQPLIYHNFKQPEPEIPLFFVSFFLGVICIAFAFYLYLLQKLQLNSNKIPQDPNSQLLVYIFIGLLFAVFGVLFLFWVKFNLIQTLVILFILSIPLFLVGNYALLSLKKEKED